MQKATTSKVAATPTVVVAAADRTAMAVMAATTLKVAATAATTLKVAATASLCDWAVEGCSFPRLPLNKCNIAGCNKLLHHLCQINWLDASGLSPGG